MFSLRSFISCSSNLDCVCSKIAWMSCGRRQRNDLPGILLKEIYKHSYICPSLCMKSDDSTHPELLSLAEKSTRAQRFELNNLGSYQDDAMAEGTDVLQVESAKLRSCEEDSLVGKMRSQFGVICPISLPLIDRDIMGFFVLLFFISLVFYKMLRFRKPRKPAREALAGPWPQVPTSFSMFLEKDFQRKESVEWVNMVLGKLWKVYRSGIENWVVGILQPVIDNLQKPAYVQRVEIKQFLLGEEPLSVRNVERRTSRLVNDLQYHIGLRYTGGARMLLSLSLKLGIFPIVVPVGVRDFDIDGELWVKLRLAPTKPYIGAVSWGFVSLPKIKIELSPFRLFNLMGIPVFSMFLCKLLTEDLPSLFVRPRKIVLDFQKSKAHGPVADAFQSGTTEGKTKDFVGELSVTLVDARKLSFLRIGRTDPYVVLKLGDQVIRSKKNSQTTVIGPPGQPIWNQDFLFFVSNPKKERLQVEVIDSLGFKDFSIGAGEVELGSLQDTVPSDRIVTLRSGFTFFGIQSSGDILLRLTYKAYVEDEDDDWEEGEAESEITNELYGDGGRISKASKETESFMKVLTALLASQEFQEIVESKMVNFKVSDQKFSGSMASRKKVCSFNESFIKAFTDLVDSNGSSLVWIAVITCIVMSVAFNMGFSDFFNP